MQDIFKKRNANDIVSALTEEITQYAMKQMIGLITASLSEDSKAGVNGQAVEAAVSLIRTVYTKGRQEIESAALEWMPAGGPTPAIGHYIARLVKLEVMFGAVPGSGGRVYSIVIDHLTYVLEKAGYGESAAHLKSRVPSNLWESTQAVVREPLNKSLKESSKALEQLRDHYPNPQTRTAKQKTKIEQEKIRKHGLKMLLHIVDGEAKGVEGFQEKLDKPIQAIQEWKEGYVTVVNGEDDNLILRTCESAISCLSMVRGSFIGGMLGGHILPVGEGITALLSLFRLFNGAGNLIPFLVDEAIKIAPDLGGKDSFLGKLISLAGGALGKAFALGVGPGAIVNYIADRAVEKDYHLEKEDPENKAPAVKEKNSQGKEKKEPPVEGLDSRIAYLERIISEAPKEADDSTASEIGQRQALYDTLKDVRLARDIIKCLFSQKTAYCLQDSNLTCFEKEVQSFIKAAMDLAGKPGLHADELGVLLDHFDQACHDLREEKSFVNRMLSFHPFG